MTAIRAYIGQVKIPERARRIRAAMAYGGFAGRKDLADAIEGSATTLQRIEGVAKPEREPKRAELLAIADVTGAPMWFLEGGWGNYPGATGRGEGDGGTGKPAGPEPRPHSPRSTLDPDPRRHQADDEDQAV